MEQHKSFMLRAIELARRGMTNGDGGPFGAVVVRHGEILGEGWNKVLRSNDPTAHGEVEAIRSACLRLGTFSLEGSVIYTTGQPCPMCLGAIYWARIERVFHGFRVGDAARVGFDDSEIFRQFSLPASQRMVPSEDCCRDEALRLIDEYAVMPGRRRY